MSENELIAAKQVVSLTDQCAMKFGVDPERMLELVKKTMISKKGEITNAEVAMVLHVMNKYDKDPILKQIHAFENKGKLNIMMGYDGWVDEVGKAASRGFLGISFTRESEQEVEVPNSGGKMVPAWIEAFGSWAPETGRTPTVYRCYFNEWFVDNENWRSRPYHRYRMKAYCQCAREALGIGLSDPVDYDQFHQVSHKDVTESTDQVMDNLKKIMDGERVFKKELTKEIIEAGPSPLLIKDDELPPDASGSFVSDDNSGHTEVAEQGNLGLGVKSGPVCSVSGCGSVDGVTICPDCKELYCESQYVDGDKCKICSGGK